MFFLSNIVLLISYYDHGTTNSTYDKQKERYNEGNLIPVHISNGRDKVNTIPEHTRESTSLNAKCQYDITDTDNTQRYEHDQPSNEPIFQSVGSKRTTRYYVGGIAPVSNRAGIVQYLRERGIKPIGLRMINTYNGDLAAKLTIESHDCDTIEHKRFWPRKRFWVKTQVRQNKHNKAAVNPNSPEYGALLTGGGIPRPGQRRMRPQNTQVPYWLRTSGEPNQPEEDLLSLQQVEVLEGFITKEPIMKPRVELSF
ncbi:hypothetical protein ACF0H5_022625 [Mactra antiquata]